MQVYFNFIIVDHNLQVQTTPEKDTTSMQKSYSLLCTQEPMTRACRAAKRYAEVTIRIPDAVRLAQYKKESHCSLASVEEGLRLF